MKVKKFLIAAIAVLLALLASCGTTGTPGSSTAGGDSGSPGTSGVSSGSSDTDDSPLYVADYLPTPDLKGLEFNILNIDKNQTQLILEFAPDASSDNIISAALYKRNNIIQNRYNMVFVEDVGGNYKDLDTKFSQIISSGETKYSLVTMIQRYAFAKAMSGYCVLVDDLPNLDVTQPWYVQDVNEQFSIAGVKVFAYSDECINLFEQTMCILYNKNIVNNSQNLVDPYDLVKAGTWTVDKFLEQARLGTQDIDGYEPINDNDIIGIVGTQDFLYPTFWIGAGLNSVKKNDDGVPSFKTATDEKFITLMDKILEYVKMDGVFFDLWVDTPAVYQYPDPGESARMIFENDHALYTITVVSDIMQHNKMKSDFGIAPAPKLDETQKSYKSRVIDGWLKVVPNTNKDLFTTSLIMEALAVESKNYVYGPYYKQALQGRYTRDDEGKSNEMLDLIFNTRTQDLGDTAWKSSVSTIFMSCFARKSATFASDAARYEDEINYNIKKEVKKITSGELGGKKS